MRKIKKKEVESYIKNGICEIPILYHCENVAFGVAEDFRSKVCVPCWYDCREIFHADYPTASHVFVNHKRQKNINFSGFLQSVEQLLGIKKPSKIYKTVRKTATIIVLSKFWKNEMRFCLLTLLIRAAIYYKLPVYSKRIFEVCKYLHDTRNAVNLFFDGKTNYIGSDNQWHKAFKYKTIAECKKLLSK